MKSNQEILLEQEEACFKRAVELVWSDAEPELTCGDIKQILLREFGEAVVNSTMSEVG